MGHNFYYITEVVKAASIDTYTCLSVIFEYLCVFLRRIIQSVSESVNLDLDLLTFRSMHAESLPWIISLPTVVLIAQLI